MIMVKRVLIILAANNFRDEEYLETKKILEKDGIEILTASRGVKFATGKFGAKVKIDLDIEKVNSKNFLALIFIGGSGSLVYKDDENIFKLINEFNRENKLICAICIAPIILANSGILKDKKASVWNVDEDQSRIFLEKEIKFSPDSCSVDGNIITANGVDASKEFAKEILNYLNKWY